ncbi:aldolase/citrate lyase family protein [Arthrobacter luteolus]|uniref:aldolase/citrate lyase family protein n=1 Tax=Arthrobacter luteolus TaxID=98672 RepID=UPI000ACDA2FC|nr:aldolase/citrate lyase family protein [Arthrobacter luteolus]
MPFRVDPHTPFKADLVPGNRARVGMWACTGNPLVTEICAGSGLDWLLIDGEHSINSLESISVQLQVAAGYPIQPVVRLPVNDQVLIKQYLDLGAQNLLVPMVDTAEQAAAAVAAVRYPPHGIRGVGSALARASRWNRIDNYLGRAGETVTLLVQVETAAAVANMAEIAATDGVDGVFIGPSDLAASMGHLGQQDHPEVVAAVEQCIRTAKELGVPVGVNAFAEATARRYLDAGVDFILVGADVALLARASEALAARYLPQAAAEEERTSY